MKIEKQNFSLPVTNYDNIISGGRGQILKKHGLIFGGITKRALVVGPSNCGKTNLMLTLITHPNGLRFTNVHICSKSLQQEKYEYLRTLLDPLSHEIGYYEYNDVDDLPAPEEIQPYSLVIFDDVTSCNQNNIKSFFSFGRHTNIDCFYLCQTYSSIPKQLIRDNTNLVIIFQQDMTNLKHIFDDHVSVDMNLSEFKNICGNCWRDKAGFLVLDKDCSLNEGRYRKGFDQYIINQVQ